MKMTTRKPFSYHVPRLKSFGYKHNSLLATVVKIVFLLFFLGLNEATSQDSGALKLSAQDFSHDFQGKSDKSSYMPLLSTSSLQQEGEDDLPSLFESKRENIKSLLHLSHNNDLPKNQTVLNSLVPTHIPFFSSENKSTFIDNKLNTILINNESLFKKNNDFIKNISELIPSELSNSIAASSNKKSAPIEKISSKVQVEYEIQHQQKLSVTKLNEENNHAFHFHSQNIWINQSILQSNVIDEKYHGHSHNRVNGDEKHLVSFEKTGPHVINRKRPKRSVMHLYDMVMCATGCNPLAYKGYGCYCGFLGSGLPVDGVDKCCAKHDWCYHHAKCPPLLTYFVPYYWTCNDGRPKCVNDYRGWKGICGAHLCECDRQFAQCLQKHPCPRSRAMCMTSPWRFWQNLVMQPPLHPYG